MTGEELIKRIKEIGAENALIVVWDCHGMLKDSDTITLTNVQNDEKTLAIVIE